MERVPIAAAIAAGVLSLLAFPAAADAQGEDHRPCVSQREWKALGPGRRPKIEHLWEVSGRGHIDEEYSLRNWALWIYPACGYRPGDAEIWIYFNRENEIQGYSVRYVRTGAIPNGNP